MGYTKLATIRIFNTGLRAVYRLQVYRKGKKPRSYIVSSHRVKKILKMLQNSPDYSYDRTVLFNYVTIIGFKKIADF